MSLEDFEARIARLERTVEHGVGVSLAEHDDAQQAAARADQLDKERQDADRQAHDAAVAAAAVEKYRQEQLAEEARLAVEARAANADEPEAEEVPATPAAVELAEEHGVDLASVEPSGAAGQVVKADVVAAVGEGA